MVKLSIITPYYNTLKYTKRLAKELSPQLTSEVEWIIIDDGSNEKALDKLNAKVFHLKHNSGNASKPRNLGLDLAAGEYIAFVDSDDQVMPDYVEKILKKINDDYFDYCYLSWKSSKYEYIIKDSPPEWNRSVWNCIYKKELIGNNRFDENFNIGEDYDFNIRVRRGIKTSIEDIIYIYNWEERKDTLSARTLNGQLASTREE